MKCLLSGLNCSTEKIIKKHYVDYQQIKENDVFLKDLLLPDTLEKKCKFCDIIFKTCKKKKNAYVFFFITVKKKVWWKAKYITNKYFQTWTVHILCD